MKLASIFTDHLVLQAGKPIRVFGTGKGCVKVTFDGQSIEKSFAEDKWCVELPPHDFGGSYEMEVELDGKKTVLHDVYVGQVLLCAGQSNMQMKMKDEITAPDSYIDSDKLRLFNVDRPEDNPVSEKMGWVNRQAAPFLILVLARSNSASKLAALILRAAQIEKGFCANNCSFKLPI